MTATKKWARYIDGNNFCYAIKNNPKITQSTASAP